MLCFEALAIVPNYGSVCILYHILNSVRSKEYKYHGTTLDEILRKECGDNCECFICNLCFESTTKSNQKIIIFRP
ncbi:hypothetical protein CLU79DRAFT_731286 [Phycomyces nitens]|nr:hypothetical protein CLU79DRAFT_731286 [Phycomyces nitens]